MLNSIVKRALWTALFWFIAAVIAFEVDLGGLFLVVALGLATGVALWVTSGDSAESGDQ